MWLLDTEKGQKGQKAGVGMFFLTYPKLNE